MKYIDYAPRFRREKIRKNLEDFCHANGIALLSIKIDWNNNEIGSLCVSADGNTMHWINESDTVIINKIKCIQ